MPAGRACSGAVRGGEGGASRASRAGQEKKEVPGAQHCACTVEMVPMGRRVSVAVIDEVQARALPYANPDERRAPCLPTAPVVPCCASTSRALRLRGCANGRPGSACGEMGGAGVRRR
jgi:hypothetical protein